MKELTLAVTTLTNTVWICKPTKTPNVMSSSRTKVDENVFIGCMLQWIENKCKGGQDTVEIESNGKTVAWLKIDRSFTDPKI
jgi:hypothetical protein